MPRGQAAWASPYLEVAPDELGHGVVVDVQGKGDAGLRLEPRSPDNGYSGHTGRLEACGQWKHVVIAPFSPALPRRR